MKKILAFIVSLFASIGFFLPITASAACSPVALGGTGSCSITSGLVLFGNGTSPIATSSVFSFNSIFSRLSVTNASTTNLSITGLATPAGTFLAVDPSGNVIATSTPSAGTGTVTNIATTFPIQGGPITTTGTLTFGGLSTTTPWTQSGLAWVFGTNKNQIASVATGTVAASGPITVTAGQSIIGSGLTIGCATCNTSSASVTSIATTYPLSGGTITTSGTLSMLWGTTTPWATGQSVFVNANGNLSSVATSTETRSAAFSSTGTVGSNVGGTSGTLSSVTQPSFTLTGTTTAPGTFNTLYGATTTLPLQQLNLGETVNGVRCKTDVGTANIQFGNGSASTTMLNASTTNNFNAFTINNTPTAGQQFSVDIGTFSGSPTKLNCTVKITI